MYVYMLKYLNMNFYNHMCIKILKHKDVTETIQTGE